MRTKRIEHSSSGRRYKWVLKESNIQASDLFNISGAEKKIVAIQFDSDRGTLEAYTYTRTRTQNAHKYCIQSENPITILCAEIMFVRVYYAARWASFLSLACWFLRYPSCWVFVFLRPFHCAVILFVDSWNCSVQWNWPYRMSVATTSTSHLTISRATSTVNHPFSQSFPKWSSALISLVINSFALFIAPFLFKQSDNFHTFSSFFQRIICCRLEAFAAHHSHSMKDVSVHILGEMKVIYRTHIVAVILVECPANVNVYKCELVCDGICMKMDSPRREQD